MIRPVPFTIRRGNTGEPLEEFRVDEMAIGLQATKRRHYEVTEVFMKTLLVEKRRIATKRKAMYASKIEGKIDEGTVFTSN